MGKYTQGDYAPDGIGPSWQPDISNPSVGNSQQIMDLLKDTSKTDTSGSNDFTNKERVQGTIGAAHAAGSAGGGVGGMMTSAGLTASMMNPAGMMAGAGLPVAGAGLLISAIESNKQRKAAQAQAEADAINNKRNQMMSLYQQDSGSNFELA